MKAIILAAGKGKRMQGDGESLPKALRLLGGTPLICHVLEELSFCEERIVVVGYRKERMMEQIGPGVRYAVQEEQLGTGHAVLAAEPLLRGYRGNMLVTFGDMPFLTREIFREMEEAHRKAESDCTLLTCTIPSGMEIPHYGRILRNGQNRFLRVKEHRDCSSEEQKIREINAGVLVGCSPLIFSCLRHVGRDNAQQEYYLTDLPRVMMEEGYRVSTHSIDDVNRIQGANTPEELARMEEWMKRQKGESL